MQGFWTAILAIVPLALGAAVHVLLRFEYVPVMEKWKRGEIDRSLFWRYRRWVYAGRIGVIIGGVGSAAGLYLLANGALRLAGPHVPGDALVFRTEPILIAVYCFLIALLLCGVFKSLLFRLILRHGYSEYLAATVLFDLKEHDEDQRHSAVRWGVMSGRIYVDNFRKNVWMLYPATWILCVALAVVGVLASRHYLVVTPNEMRFSRLTALAEKRILYQDIEAIAQVEGYMSGDEFKARPSVALRLRSGETIDLGGNDDFGVRIAPSEIDVLIQRLKFYTGLTPRQIRTIVEFDGPIRFDHPGPLFHKVIQLSQQPVPDVRTLYELVHWETPKQRVWRDYAFDYEVPMQAFARACADRFQWWRLAGYLRHIASLEVAVIDDGRARAECVNDDGREWTLHLVRVGERWLVSGYTFERDRSLGFDDDDFEARVQAQIGRRPAIEAVTRRVRDGEFSTLEEAAAALGEALTQVSQP